MAPAVSGRWTRLRTLGRGASGAVVSLASDDESGELFAVKSAGAADAGMLRREQRILSGLCSPHIVPCIGGAEGGDGSYNLFLEFAPGGTLADEVARSGGRLEEIAIRAYAADVVRGLAYLHGISVVHGDVKGRNVVVGADGRAKLADFGCARSVDSLKPVGGTPAFMAPEVARGEEQGPAADVWALGCTVIEMATGRAPWSDMDDVVAAVHRIGYTEAVPEVPAWLSPEAKDFLDRCLRRRPSDRCTAGQLSEHPFVALAGREVKTEQVKQEWLSPKSTLDPALWESETDDEADDTSESTAGRIRALAGTISALPDWDPDEGWIDVRSTQIEASDALPEPVEETAATDIEVELLGVDEARGARVHNIGLVDGTIEQATRSSCNLDCDEVSCQSACTKNNAIEFVFAQILLCHPVSCSCSVLAPFRKFHLIYLGFHTGKFFTREILLYRDNLLQSARRREVLIKHSLPVTPRHARRHSDLDE